MSGPGTAVAATDGRSLDERRFDASRQILAERAQRQLAEMSDEEFEKQVKLMQVARERIERVIATLFVRDKHFGNPELKGGGKAFQKDICFQGGSDLLQQVFRLHVEMIGEPIVMFDAGWCSVTIRAGIYNQFGGELGQTIASCNTLEPRFYKGNGNTPTWRRDPREKLNDCQAMALKRAAVRLSLAVTGGSAYFLSDEALAEVIEEGVAEAVCSDAERAQIREAAKQKGMKNADLFRVLVEATGRGAAEGEAFPVVFATEVRDVLDAIARWAPRTPVPVEEPTKPVPAPPGVPLADDSQRAAQFAEFPEALRDEDDELPF